MIKKILFILASIFFVHIWLANLIFDFTWKVVNVVDWDTIWVETKNMDVKIRILWIDAPEILHSGIPVKFYKFYWCWIQSKEFAEKLLLGKIVKVYRDSISKNRDKYGRYLRYVFIPLNLHNKRVYLPFGAISLYKWMSRVYRYENFILKNIYFKLEKIAKHKRIWIWSSYCKKEDKIIKEKFLKKEKNPCFNCWNNNNIDFNSSCGYTYHKIWCDIKGNINKRWEKIYHLPWRKYYNSTIITPSKWERRFCSEAQALRCWRRPSKIR